MKENVITDRTVLDVIAFTNLAKSIDFKDKEYFEDYARVFVGQYDYIFYISPEGTVMEDNGVRETDENYRDLIDKSF
jgi:mRNA deadenylase 3'-5' endonuclease subunit Ccr4